MRVTDAQAWQERRAALIADGETGQAFLAFVEDWTDEVDRTWDDQTTTADWVRAALPAVEARHSRVGAHYLGQMLWVLGEHWIWGHNLMNGLSTIERRLVEDCVIIKVAEEQERATQFSSNADL